MKSNIVSEYSLKPGVYWVCDPSHIMPEEMIEDFADGILEWGIWSTEGFKSFVGDTEGGFGCYAFTDWWKDNGIETETGYIGIFPDALIRKMRMITQMKKWNRIGVVRIEMDYTFSIEKTDHHLEIGHHRLEKVLGV
jgi:hypothetical protein